MIKVEVNTVEVNEKITDKLFSKLSRAGEIGRQEAYNQSRYKSSDMRNSTEYEVEKTGDGLTLTLGQGSRQIHYPKYQELGTKGRGEDGKGGIEGTHQVKKGIQRAVQEFKS